MTAPRWKFWGWGYEGSGLTPDETRRLLQFYADRFGLDEAAPEPPPTVADVALRPSRLEPPARVARQRPHQRCLAVVDVTGGAQDQVDHNRPL